MHDISNSIAISGTYLHSDHRPAYLPSYDNYLPHPQGWDNLMNLNSVNDNRTIVAPSPGIIQERVVT